MWTFLGSYDSMKIHGREATVTSVMSPGRYGALEVRSDKRVERFVEKPSRDLGLINGGFFVLNRFGN